MRPSSKSGPKSPDRGKAASRNYLEVTSLSAIEHMVEHCPERIQRLIIFGSGPRTNPRVDRIQQTARAAKVAVDLAPPGDRGIDPVKAYVAPFEYAELAEWLETLGARPRALVLALDHLQDPQNFGALCRTAEALGIAGILLPKDRSVTVGPGVYSASVGAVETVPIVMVNNLGDGLRKLKDAGFWIVGTCLGAGATPPAEIPDFEKVVLVLGAELEGLSPSLEKVCDWRTEIPLQGKVQSLNVSVAGAILMWELSRKAMDKRPSID